MTITIDGSERSILKAIVDSGAMCKPSDEETKKTCNSLTEKKLLRTHTALDGNSSVGSPRITVMYSPTAAGKKMIAGVA